MSVLSQPLVDVFVCSLFLIVMATATERREVVADESPYQLTEILKRTGRSDFNTDPNSFFLGDFINVCLSSLTVAALILS